MCVDPSTVANGLNYIGMLESQTEQRAVHQLVVLTDTADHEWNAELLAAFDQEQ